MSTSFRAVFELVNPLCQEQVVVAGRVEEFHVLLAVSGRKYSREGAAPVELVLGFDEDPQIVRSYYICDRL